MLVKHTTLLVIAGILERTVDALEYLTDHSGENNQEDFPSLLREAVLKFLPDAQTLISLRQNLSSMTSGSETDSKQENNRKLKCLVECF